MSTISVATLSTTTARADDMPTRPERRESGNRPPSSVRVPTLVAGVLFTAGWWGLGTATSYGFDTSPGMKRLRVPVVGPWMGLRENSCQGSCTFSYYLRGFWFIFDGLAQAGGLGVALESILLPTGGVYSRATTPSSPGSPGSPSLPSPSAPSNDGPSRTPGPATDPGTPSTPPPSGKDLYWIPRPMPVGQAGFGLGVFGAF